MSSVDETQTENQEHVLNLIKDIQFAMLTTVEEDGSLRSRPMAYKHGQSDSKNQLWFITRKDAPKISEIKNHSQVNVSFSNPNNAAYVSISGRAEVIQDKEKAKELWNPYLKSWFPDGLDDLNMILLKITINTAEYWDSSSSFIVRAVGYVKAAFRDESALDSDHKRVTF